MTRYEKYDPISGGFRAILEADLDADANGSSGILGLSINTSGRAVVGTAAATGLVGVTVKNAPKQYAGRFATSGQGAPNPDAWIGLKAGDVVDIMTSGEIADLDDTDWDPGDSVYVHADGSVDSTVGADGIKVGWIVGSGAKMRAVIRVGLHPAAIPAGE